MDKKIITTYNEFLDLEEDWIRLEAQDPDAFVYNSFSFTKAWLETYEKDPKISPLIITVYQNNKIVGIAPFYIYERQKTFIKWKELQFINKGDYHNLLIDQSPLFNQQKIIREIMEYTEEIKESWDRLLLSYMDSRSELAHYYLKDESMNPYLKYLVESPTLYISDYPNFDVLKKQFPKNVKNFRNKLRKEVQYTFEVHKSMSEELYKSITNLHRQEQEYLKNIDNKKERRSLYNDSLRNEYIKKVSLNKEIYLFLLRDSSGDIICYNYNFCFKDILYSWNIAYNPKYRNYTTNAVLYYEILQYLYEIKDFSEFDFGAGRYPWKFRWTKTFHLLYELDFWKPRTRTTKFLSTILSYRK